MLQDWCVECQPADVAVITLGATEQLMTRPKEDVHRSGRSGDDRPTRSVSQGYPGDD